MKKAFFTVYVFAKLNTLRYFRDPIAIFFTVAFPLIFMFVIGGIFGKSGDASFKVSFLNESSSQFAQKFVDESSKNKLLKINNDIKTPEMAREKMTRGELDATIVLPPNFGEVKPGAEYPTGQAIVRYTQNNQQAAQTLTSVLEIQFKQINSQFVKADTPFTVASEATADKQLSNFDYTFSGLLGFSIIGLGIFGPINIFPELKKQGILRRLSTTPLKVWQYFVSTALSQIIIGLFTMTILFAFALIFFHLNVAGNYLELALYLVFGIAMILGIGLALGGWAKNERQVAPLANIVVFPMMFLSGTFFPRFLMPDWLQTASSFLPLTPVIDGIRLIATEGKHFIDLMPQLGLMALWMLVIYVIAFRVFRWE